MKKSGVFLVKDNLPQLLRALSEISKQDVLVGIPEDKTARSGEITNAALLYIHNHGAPEANIPARPVMEPGIQDARSKIVANLKKGAEAVLNGNAEGMTAGLHAAGLAASTAIKRRINAGPPPPLALSTIKARARRGSQDAKRYLAFMDWPAAAQQAARAAGEMGSAKPLVVTGAMRNAVTYVLRKNGKDVGEK